MADPFLGEIRMFSGNFAPRGWAFCDGQLLAIAQDSALFSILGTTYGGDGRTTFGLPDLRGRSPVHKGTGPGLANVALGEKGGAETTTLALNQIPSHTHTINARSDAATQAVPTNHLLARGADAQGGIIGNFTDETPDVTMAPNMVGTAGGGQAVDNRSPYLGLNFIIAIAGGFPP